MTFIGELIVSVLLLIGIFFLLVGFPIAIAVLLLGLFLRPLKKEVQHRPPKPLRETTAYRWSRLIQRRPWAAAILGAADCTLWALDRDPDAIARGAALAARHPGRLHLVEARFGDMMAALSERGVTARELKRAETTGVGGGVA